MSICFNVLKSNYTVYFPGALAQMALGTTQIQEKACAPEY